MKTKKPELGELVDLLQQKWPAGIVTRSEIGKLTGGLVNPKTIANEDALGVGISSRLRLLRRVAYKIEDVAEYLIRKGLVFETVKKNE